MVVKVQSCSDIITNSSTEVYLLTGGTQYVKELIDTLLKLAGSDYTCDELFRIDDLENYYHVTALDNSNSEIAAKIDVLLNSLFYADGDYNG